MKSPWYVWLLAILVVGFIIHLREAPKKKARKEHMEEVIKSRDYSNPNIRRQDDNTKYQYNNGSEKYRKDVENMIKVYDGNNSQTMDLMHLSDDELQQLREELEYDTEGRYFHIPGRRILTREQETQEAIENYIEDNIDDIMDEYSN